MGGAGGGLIAAGAEWTWRTSGFSGPRSLTPRRMYQHACGNKLFVAWARHDRMLDTEWTAQNGLMREKTIGRIATFQTSADGTLTQISDVELAECNDMGAIVTTNDCSTVAALCKTDLTVTPASVPGAADFIAGTYCQQYPDLAACHAAGVITGFHGDDTLYVPSDGQTQAEYQQTRGVNRMWLYEWSNGVVSTTPDSKTHINAAIGGTNYGHWELSLNNDDTVYMFDLKTSNGGHEGAINDALWRGNKSKVLGIGGKSTVASETVVSERTGLTCTICITSDLLLKSTSSLFFSKSTLLLSPI